jgi:hypothetical protein
MLIILILQAAQRQQQLGARRKCSDLAFLAACPHLNPFCSLTLAGSAVTAAAWAPDASAVLLALSGSSQLVALYLIVESHLSNNMLQLFAHDSACFIGSAL